VDEIENTAVPSKGCPVALRILEENKNLKVSLSFHF
jgi:hypothetical protein